MRALNVINNIMVEGGQDEAIRRDNYIPTTLPFLPP